MESQAELHETLQNDAPSQQPVTLVSCALQVLVDAGHLDFNIQDTWSLLVALTRM